MADDPEARKKRTNTKLKAEKVPICKHLPWVETVETSKRRTTEEVAERAIALCLVAVRGEGVEKEITDKLVYEYQIARALSPKERAFLKKVKPTQHDRIQFSWRYECYWVMLWALGFVRTLSRPEKVCDVKKAVTILRDLKRDGFLKKAKLRPQEKLLDQADLIYRYHWAVVDARINGKKTPGKLHPGVVMERHYALNWLVGYSDQKWDDITTDT